MSKKINVNPDHYKTRGREPQGQDVPHEVVKQRAGAAMKQERKQGKAPRIPGTTGRKKPAPKS